MTLPMAAWRVTYTPGDWLVLSGPTTLVVMLPAPALMSQLVNRLWDDVVAARSVDALLELFAEYGLDGMPDFAAFFWDANGLHGMARGDITVIDTETGEAAVTGADVVTWREESLGVSRHLRVDMDPVDQDEHLQLPLVVGAVSASTIHLSTDAASQVRFPDREQLGVLPRVPVLEVIGLGDETDMEPYVEPEAAAEDSDTAADPEPEFPQTPGPEPASDAVMTQKLRLDDDDPDEFPMYVPPTPTSAPAVVPGNFTTGDEDGGGTIFSTGLAATHKAPAPPQEERQVLAVTCPRGHPNPPGSRNCRLCSAPVDSANPRLINRPPLAGVHSNQGEFADLQVAILVGRSPDAGRAPRGAHLMRVSSPSSDISDWSVIVTDLDSTNGTTVNPVGEQPFILANGDSVQVDMGTILELGDGVSLRIEGPRG